MKSRQLSAEDKHRLRGISVSDNIWKECAAAAATLGLTKSAYIRRLIESDVESRKVRLGHAKEFVRMKAPSNNNSTKKESN